MPEVTVTAFVGMWPLSIPIVTRRRCHFSSLKTVKSNLLGTGQGFTIIHGIIVPLVSLSARILRCYYRFQRAILLYLK